MMIIFNQAARIKNETLEEIKLAAIVPSFLLFSYI